MNDFKVGDRFSVEGVVTALADREGDYRALFDGHDSDGYVIGAEMAHAKLIQPKPRYDWSNIPPEYDWAATDRGGAAYAYKNKPFCKDHANFWIGKDSGDMFRLCAGQQLTEDWRDSLEQRPEVVDPITPCKGTNCGSTTGMNHSPECEAEHIAAITGAVVENKVLDLSKPVRIVSSGVGARYVGHMSNGRIVCEFRSDAFVFCSDFREKELENIPEPKRRFSREAVLVTSLGGGEPYLTWDNCIPCGSTILARINLIHTEGEGWSVEEVK